VQLLGRAKFWTEDENPKEKVKFLKGGEEFRPPRGEIGGEGENPGTPA
jgi:hypothetical protein